MDVWLIFLSFRLRFRLRAALTQGTVDAVPALAAARRLNAVAP